MEHGAQGEHNQILLYYFYFFIVFIFRFLNYDNMIIKTDVFIFQCVDTDKPHRLMVPFNP